MGRMRKHNNGKELRVIENKFMQTMRKCTGIARARDWISKGWQAGVGFWVERERTRPCVKTYDSLLGVAGGSRIG